MAEIITFTVSDACFHSQPSANVKLSFRWTFRFIRSSWTLPEINARATIQQDESCWKLFQDCLNEFDFVLQSIVRVRSRNIKHIEGRDKRSQWFVAKNFYPKWTTNEKRKTITCKFFWFALT